MLSSPQTRLLALSWAAAAAFHPPALSSALPTSSSPSPLVTVRNGTYRGVYVPTYDQDFFLGLPYAQPPVGPLRFQNPQPLDLANASWAGVRDATAYSAECWGFGSDDWVLGNPCSEDCLTLNVVRPAGVTGNTTTATNSTQQQQLLPVAVWIYGGGGYEGGSLDPRYNLSFIVTQSVRAGTPFLAVSLNYRVQALGFLAGREVAAEGVSNLGYKDQRQALRWIQENIASFGGDPAKVTIWGESAGATSVGIQLTAYGGRDEGLFRGAIMQSGGSYGGRRWLDAAGWQPHYDNITRAVACDGANDTLACLRAVPIATLVAALNGSVTASIDSWEGTLDGTDAAPALNAIIPRSPTAALRAGAFARVPILHGRNADEGTGFATKGLNTTAEFIADAMAQDDLPRATAETLALLYPDIPAVGVPGAGAFPDTAANLARLRPGGDLAYLGAMWKRAAAYTGDVRMHAGRRLMSALWAAHDVTSYSYVFNVLVNGMADWQGATHFSEVAFVFDNLAGDGYHNAVAEDPFAGEPASYARLADVMSRMWVSFVVDGDPNAANVTDLVWPPYARHDPQNFVFDANITGLVAVAPDTYRAAQIAYIQSKMESEYGF